MQVLTLNPSEFNRHAARLAMIVAEDGPKYFDAVVAVRRGGTFVCDAFCRHFPQDRYGARYDVRLQRPTTKHKNETISLILKKLPIPVLNLMRIAESTILSFRRKIKDRSNSPNVELPDGLVYILKNFTVPHILVIDDAIDSGDTLLAIVSVIRRFNPNVTIKIAVMTETTKSPCIHADYSLYKNKTLIRFPWSNDYKSR